ncbi:hypothetical protein K437DRAFT_3683 [Tilletiaria anomala UBC 951]|uniref:Uncharacterized protein n=1 Tax=Tilletiaria anomala (strain ATCC 24038 / CBS 436.72 / UBC 951) TaxID=1037660 RepID=A0A066WHX7_TILAU|nr:uncharacterized protein K437DRAFT_3683 [Tilletiaria anomala UBC 951]KDN53622.1 hypothetical protein K437DRAFT_3683 [Tilletiaria anomala UBC 951]
MAPHPPSIWSQRRPQEVSSLSNATYTYPLLLLSLHYQPLSALPTTDIARKGKSNASPIRISKPLLAFSLASPSPEDIPLRRDQLACRAFKQGLAQRWLHSFLHPHLSQAQPITLITTSEIRFTRLKGSTWPRRKHFFGYRAISPRQASRLHCLLSHHHTTRPPYINTQSDIKASTAVKLFPRCRVLLHPRLA